MGQRRRRFENLRYTRHARQRMEERRISEEDVSRIINEADLTYPSYGKTVAEELLSGGRELRVVHVPEPRPSPWDARIISAIDLEEPRD